MMPTIDKFLAAIFLTGFGTLTHATAQTSSFSADTLNNAAQANEKQGLPYKHAMQCAAYNTFMAGIIEEEDPETAKPFSDSGKRWLTMAYARDGEDGVKAEREFDEVFDKLLEKVEELSEQDEKLEEFLTDFDEICAELADENAEEFNSITFDE